MHCTLIPINHVLKIQVPSNPLLIIFFYNSPKHAKGHKYMYKSMDTNKITKVSKSFVEKEFTYQDYLEKCACIT